MAAPTRRAAPAGSPSSGRSAMLAALDEDTQTRFLREMALRLPLDRVVEAHVFPAIRQGGAETGVAVIAARRESAAAPVVPTAPADVSPAGERVDAGALDAPADAGVECAVEGAPPHEEVAMPEGAARHQSDAGVAETSQLAEPVPAEGVAPSRHAPHPVPLPDRHTVFSARYRLTLKGPDRGRWEMDVVEEADAPLVTVDAVVRGVQRRAGEGAEPERFTAEQLRALVAGPATAAAVTATADAGTPTPPAAR